VTVPIVNSGGRWSCVQTSTQVLAIDVPLLAIDCTAARNDAGHGGVVVVLRGGGEGGEPVGEVGGQTLQGLVHWAAVVEQARMRKGVGRKVEVEAHPQPNFHAFVGPLSCHLLFVVFFCYFCLLEISQQRKMQEYSSRKINIKALLALN
jgi:hypothetical protein